VAGTFPEVKGLGQIPLSVISLEGRTMLVVTPEAAIGTDLIGLANSIGLFLCSKSVLARILSGIGMVWMASAAVVEASKLASGPHRRYTERLDGCLAPSR